LTVDASFAGLVKVANEFIYTTDGKHLYIGSDLVGEADFVKLSGATLTGPLVFTNNGVRIKDTDGSHNLIIVAGSNLTSDRTLTIVTGDADRTISLGGNITTGGQVTMSGEFSITITATANTNVNLPASGTLAINPAIPSTDHTACGPAASFTAGTALSFGQVCYMGSDGKMELGDADTVASAFAWAMATATVSEDASGTFALPGAIVRDDSWNWTSIGQPVFLDTATAGGMTQTAPSGTDDVIQIVGIALSADVILFYPQLVQVEHT
jgi:hypothetical protein